METSDRPIGYCGRKVNTPNQKRSVEQKLDDD